MEITVNHFDHFILTINISVLNCFSCGERGTRNQGRYGGTPFGNHTAHYIYIT